MSFLKKAAIAAVAMTMTTAPVMAATNSASSLSLSPNVRAGKTVTADSKLSGSGGYVVAIVAAAAVIAGIIIVADNNDSPDSP